MLKSHQNNLVLFVIFSLKLCIVFGNENVFISDQKNLYYIESQQMVIQMKFNNCFCKNGIQS